MAIWMALSMWRFNWRSWTNTSNRKLNEAFPLQEVLREMEKQNQEFTKREKLSQFELEKTRSKLVALEKSKLLPEGQPEGP